MIQAPSSACASRVRARAPHFSQLILINTAREPVRRPDARAGRHGRRRGGLHAGLQAIGFASATAMSTAIAFRLVTFYLPPIWGAYGMRWLRKHEYV